MGVDNLMGFVKNATTSTSITRIGLPGSTAAVDVSHWIYRACYACPEVLYHRDNMSVAYRIIINYIDNYVQLLKAHDVQLTIVFDGMKLPAKQVTHKERALRKQEARKLVEKALAKGDKSEARKQMLRCTEVKWDMIQQVLDYCKKEKLNYIVAPYEADAQLAFLNISHICDYVITEDTDLILYGCQKIIYKLDANGHCVLYEKAKLAKCLGPHGDQVEFEKFRRICILSGCDYLKNIPGVGLQSAKKFFLMTRQDNIRMLLPKLSIHLKAPKLAGKVTEEYIRGFINAETTFKHHIVYDPVNEKLTPLEPYPRGTSASDFPLAGKKFHNAMAVDFVKGCFDLDALNPEVDLDDASDVSEDDDDDVDTENTQNEIQSTGYDKNQIDQRLSAGVAI